MRATRSSRATSRSERPSCATDKSSLMLARDDAWLPRFTFYFVRDDTSDSENARTHASSCSLNIVVAIASSTFVDGALLGAALLVVMKVVVLVMKVVVLAMVAKFAASSDSVVISFFF